MNFIGYILIILAGIILLAGFLLWRGNNRLTLTELNVRSKKISKPTRIVHFSDLHNKQFGKDSGMLIRLIRVQKPDLIVCTGDLEDRRQSYHASPVALLSSLTEIAPVCFVFGNQEMRGNFLEKLTDGLRKGGVAVLDDQSLQLSLNGQPFSIFGINDFRCERRRSAATQSKKLLGQFCETGGFRLLLTHYPQHFAFYSRSYHYCDYPIDLVLAGHAHGGLIRLPFLKGIIAPGQGFFPKYTAGLYEQNGVKMVVSRGLGNSGWPLRVGNPPEVVSVTLLPE